MSNDQQPIISSSSPNHGAPDPTPNSSPADPPAGRPRALDDAKRRDVSPLVSAGCGLEVAARHVGCNPTTLRREARRNPDFRDQLRLARRDCELSPLQAMHKAAKRHWRPLPGCSSHPCRSLRQDRSPNYHARSVRRIQPPNPSVDASRSKRRIRLDAIIPHLQPDPRPLRK